MQDGLNGWRRSKPSPPAKPLALAPAPALRRCIASLRALGRCGAGLLALGLVALLPGPLPARAQQSLTIAAFPAVDDIVRAAIPQWKALHPTVDIKVVSRQFSDHHTAMTTALSTAVYLPDVMALEVGYLGRFAQGGGLDDLALAPYNIGQFRARYVPYAYAQATSRSGRVVAAPTDIGPGTLLYRSDLLAQAGISETELTQSWDSYVAAGVRLKARTGAYLMAHARDIKDIVIRTGIQPGEGLYFDQQSRRRGSPAPRSRENWVPSQCALAVPGRRSLHRCEG